MDMKITLWALLAQNLAFFAIFNFFGFYTTSVAPKYWKGAKNRFFKKKSQFFENRKIWKLIPKRKIFKISEIENLGFKHDFSEKIRSKVDLEKKLELYTLSKKKKKKKTEKISEKNGQYGHPKIVDLQSV